MPKLHLNNGDNIDMPDMLGSLGPSNIVAKLFLCVGHSRTSGDLPDFIMHEVLGKIDFT